ncbi:MAG: TIGR03364 family FAD-dependent oxidoreductase [Leptolyngbyaceae bacterium]|nr:TIGR03364 family FAD-dependent oxidoreductase [Leptolyngbyaceae bacterium]
MIPIPSPSPRSSSVSQSSSQATDVAIVGAGIVGLAHALAAAKQGRKVTVFERNPYAVGASIRNFGMIWPIGQPVGVLRDRALRTRDIWLDIAPQSAIAIDPCGSLHLAYHADEMAVLEEFLAKNADGDASNLALLTPTQVAEKSPAVVQEGLLGALWSRTETIVDPREAIRNLPDFLHRAYGVEFHFGTVVTDVCHPILVAGGDTWTAQHIFVCSGADFETLYPDLYRTSFQEGGLTKVKLQMMRTAPQPNQFRIGPALAAGLTLTHYAAFADCPSLPALKARMEHTMPQFPRWGIHVMMSQNASGELVIGDSHEYGWNPEPFDRSEINQYILDYLKTFAHVPSFDIDTYWHGVYAKLPGKTEFIASPETGVTVVNALSGAGMTLSFGLAEEVIHEVFGAPTPVPTP